MFSAGLQKGQDCQNYEEDFVSFCWARRLEFVRQVHFSTKHAYVQFVLYDLVTIFVPKAQASGALFQFSYCT